MSKLKYIPVSEYHEDYFAAQDRKRSRRAVIAVLAGLGFVILSFVSLVYKNETGAMLWAFVGLGTMLSAAFFANK